MTRFVLYGTLGCHLCEEAEELLRQCSAEGAAPCLWETFDITLDDALFARYGIRIPVLLHPASGTELAWPFDREMLAEWLVSLLEPASGAAPPIINRKT